MSQKSKLWKMVLGGVLGFLLILVVVLFLAGRFLSSPAVIKKIQHAIATRTGIEVVYQSIDLRYLPSLAISLQQVTLNIPGYGQTKVAEIRIFPEFLPLLTGQVRTAGLELENPEVTIDLPASGGDTKTAELSSSRLEQDFADLLAPFAGVVSNLDLTVHNGRLIIDQRHQPLIAAEQINLQLHLAVESPRSGKISAQASASTLSLWRNGHREELEDFSLDGNLLLADGAFNGELKNLSVAEPALELEGALALAPSASEVSLNLTGSNINVDQVRRSTLALAGDVPLVSEIFTYLRGGKIPSITVRSRASDLAGLGELNNLHIEGQLQAGAVSIPQLKLDLTDVVSAVQLADGILQGTGMSTKLEGSSGHDGTLKVGLGKGNDLFQLELMLNADFAHVKHILERVVANRVFVEKLEQVTRFEGTGTGKLTLGDSLADLRARVHVEQMNFSADYQPVPFPIKVNSGQVAFTENLVSLKNWQGSIGSSHFEDLSATIDLNSGDINASEVPGRVELILDGVLDKDVVGWLNKTFKVSQDYAVKAPVTLSNASVDWRRSGSTRFQGGVAIQNGPSLILDVSLQPGQVSIKTLKLKDQYSDSDMALNFDKSGLSLKFSGELQHESLDALFVKPPIGQGRVKGDFSVAVSADQATGPEASGQLTGTGLSFPLPSGEQVVIAEMALAANASRVAADLSSLSWHNLTWTPVKGEFNFIEDKIRLKVTEAKLCGIDSPGEGIINDKTLALDLKLESQQVDVAQTYTCLTQGKGEMTGTLDVAGQISAKGRFDELVGKLQGPLEMTFSNGVIKRDLLLAKILEILNITEVFAGKIPDLRTEGLAYTSINLQGKFENGKLHIAKFHMDGETLDLIGNGEIDLLEGTVSFQMMAAPFKTANTIIKHLPGINYLMAGSLVAIPVSIEGPLDDPKASILSASSVGSSLLKLGERIIKSPIRLIESVLPLEEEGSQ